MTRRLVLASRSRHKVGELQELLGLADVVLVTPDEVGIEGEPVEDADSFEGNAQIKVRYYAERSGLPTLADDSGLEVDALGGGPGVYTKRYAGPAATDEDNNSKLLEELEGLPAEQRGARYQCVLAFLDPSGRGRSGLPRRFLRGPHRHRAARQRWLRLRPHLRTGGRGARRPHGRADEQRGEARAVASRQGRPGDGRVPRRGGLVDVERAATTRGHRR